MAAEWSDDVVAGVERWVAVQGGASGAALLHGLRTAGPAPLAGALAEKRLAGPPASEAEVAGLAGAQVEAFRACLSTGIHLVWSPPGAGATQVLARAVEELVRQDKRVLLVSTAEAAVDEVLHAVVRETSPEPGVAIRVGSAHLPDNAGETDVRLERLAAQESREVDGQRDAAAARLREIDDLDAQVGQLRAELGDYDDAAYRAAAARRAAGPEVDVSRLEEAEATADAARRAAVAAATELQEALAARAELDPVRDALDHERRAVEGLAVLEDRQQALQRERDELDVQDSPLRWRERRRHRREVEDADAALRRFVDAAAEGRRRWLDVQLEARATIGPHSREEVDRVDRRVVDAEIAVAAADEAYRRTRDVLAGLRTARDEREAAGEPTEEDRRLVADAEARGLPTRHARLRELVQRQEDAAARRDALDAEHRALVDRARTERAEAEAQLVGKARAVATTLARSREHPALADAAFDVVLVDGAGAAALAEVLLVLCRATTTAVLFGESAQRGLDDAVREDADPALQRWVAGTCFTHVGIESAADAAEREGCIALPARIPEQRSPPPAPAPRSAGSGRLT